jgi:NAD(P)-dependent dehydrogenase (short-subunit alcohol dehydrogenase family)
MQNKHVLICGGTGGLGTAVVQSAVSHGARVTVPYINHDEVKLFQNTHKKEITDQVNFVKTDLSDEMAVKKIIDKMQRVDVLIQLVGGFSMGDTIDFSIEQWQKLISINLTTTFLICKHSLRRMKETGYGRIVTVGSRAAVEPSGKMACYSASKAAVIAFTKSIADEMKGTNITANCILPSTIDTPANRKAMGTGNVHKWVKPESVAQIICFLGSESATDLRGAAIPIYGND